jgi:hypothetical protein
MVFRLGKNVNFARNARRLVDVQQNWQRCAKMAMERI